MTNPNDPAYPEVYINGSGQRQEIPGITKREYFATKSDGPPEDASAKYVAMCLGWPIPTYSKGCVRKWSLWWRSAISAWKIANADALIDELNKEPK